MLGHSLLVEVEKAQSTRSDLHLFDCAGNWSFTALDVRMTAIAVHDIEARVEKALHARQAAQSRSDEW